MKYLIIALFLMGCENRHELVLCKEMCNSAAQDHVQIKQYSMGTCICDNEEGRKVSLGYHLLLDNRCKIPKDRKSWE